LSIKDKDKVVEFIFHNPDLFNGQGIPGIGYLRRLTKNKYKRTRDF